MFDAREGEASVLHSAVAALGTQLLADAALPHSRTYRVLLDRLDMLTIGLLVLLCAVAVLHIVARRRAVQKLRDAQARAKTIVRAIPDLLFCLNRQGVFLDYKADEKDLYTGPDNIIGRRCRDVLPAEIADLVECRIRNTLDSGEMQIFEYRLSVPGRGMHDYDARMVPTGADEVTAFIRDITDRKQAENIMQLRVRLLEFAAGHSLEELLQKALDELGEITNSPIGFYHFVEADQRTLSLQAWSTRTQQEFCKAEGKGLHYSLDEAGVWVDCVGRRQPVIHNDYASLPHRKGLPDGHAQVIRELVVPTMREDRIVSILGVGNKTSEYDEQDVKLVAYVADVVWNTVERKRAEARLRDYQGRLEAQNLELRRLSLAIEQSGSTVLITDAEGTITYANPRFEVTSGYTVEEALGKNPRILKSGKQSADYYRVLWETITRGDVWHGEFHNQRKDGTLYWELATIAPVQDDTGRVVNYIAVKEDITESKQAQEDLREYADRLAAQNDELDTFAHTVAHDLKNPVSIVTGCGEILAREVGDSQNLRVRECTDIIVRTGLKVNTIIEELLLLAMVRKTGQVSLSPLDMSAILVGVQERMVVRIAEQRAQISLPAAWPPALGHAPWIEEVWINYLDNAIKYGGHPPRAELGADVTGIKDTSGRNMVRFWVRDNGNGLSEKERARLFAPFERLGQARVRGHGLGLSIVRRIVEKLGGQVGVESDGATGEGSLFYFTLPRAE